MKLLKLKDVCSVNSGISPPKDKKIFENGTVPFYKTLDVGRIKIGNISDSELKVSQAFADSKKVFEPGTILFPKSGASTLLNHRVVIQKKGLVASTLAAIVPIKDLCLSKYLYYYLLTIDAKDFIPESFYPGMKISEISEIPIPVPSLQEQEKIVERLDKVFENIEKKNNSIKDQLSNLDQLQNSIMEKIFSNLNGKVYDLGDIVNLLNGRAYKKEELLDQGKYKVLRVGNLFTSNKWYFSDLELGKDKYCNKGDLLYAWSASFGPHFWNEDSTIYHYHIWKLQFDKNVIDKDFLYFWLLYDKEKIKKASGTGTTMMHVSKTSMEKRKLTLPPIKEQEKIAQNLNLVFNLSKELTNKYHKKSELNKSLENSLLHKEFSYE